MTDTMYLLQLPYLNDNGAPVVVCIRKYDAENLRDNKTHKLLASDGVVVVTPIAAAVTNHAFQLGGKAY